MYTMSMNDEVQNPEEFQEESKFKRELTTVTPFSKFLAMVIFIAAPFVGGWVGYQYAPEKIVEVERIVTKEVSITEQENTPDYKNWSTTQFFSLAISYPSNWEAISGDADSASGLTITEYGRSHDKKQPIIQFGWSKFSDDLEFEMNSLRNIKGSVELEPRYFKVLQRSVPIFKIDDQSKLIYLLDTEEFGVIDLSIQNWEMLSNEFVTQFIDSIKFISSQEKSKGGIAPMETAIGECNEKYLFSLKPNELHENFSSLKHCYAEVGIKFQDASVCELIGDEAYGDPASDVPESGRSISSSRDQCLLGIAEATLDESYCAEIHEDSRVEFYSTKIYCYSSLSFEKNDESICQDVYGDQCIYLGNFE